MWDWVYLMLFAAQLAAVLAIVRLCQPSGGQS
jgi:hypothetical protein